MKRSKTKGKVVKFTQSETVASTFRHDYPVSEDLRQVMVSEVLGDFLSWAIDRKDDDEFLTVIEEFVHGHEPRDEKRDVLLHNLFWWRLFFHSNSRSSSLKEYMAQNYHKLRKRPLILSWLKECAKAIPKFYHIGYKYNDRVLVVTDMLEAKTLDVIVYDPLAIPPKKGEIVMGTLLPLGDGLYFPIIDFYHFDYDARQDIASHLFHYYDKHLKNSTMHEAFIHVLSVMLQIQKLVLSDTQTT
ncbi:hypothetical protein ACFSCX_16130 [Bacillus salitolerans]|uniref:Uncharacterized protein n=1 Tax=Bacillus salitolerans TaxID=1437434 RepID=A0ABW4LSB8_9BACI